MRERSTEAEMARGMEPVAVEKADRDVVIRHFVDGHGRNFPRSRDRMVAGCEEMIAAMMQDAVDGDELWICRSRHVGMLAGHEGLGIVREGSIVEYRKIVQY